MELPVLKKAEEIARAARPGARLIIASPPGSGKSTKVPQLLLDRAGLKGRIAVLQPRRLAARLLADRVASERGGRAGSGRLCPLSVPGPGDTAPGTCGAGGSLFRALRRAGQGAGSTTGGEVGYRVRFDDRTGPATRIIFETEGILLRELVSDPLLKKYSAVILDEFHERHLHGDITLAACLALQKGPRPDLIVAVMSATMDEAALAAHMRPCAVIKAEGTLYPVRTVYCDPATAALPPWEAAARTCAALLPPLKEGHALVFMPGAFEINRTAAEIAKVPALSGFRVMPLHGEMKPGEQDAAVAPSGGRRIIIATNIAETSVTIDGVAAVVDSGLARVPRFDGPRGINTLFTERISAASAAQRAGRAGRTGPGVCARLWTEREHQGLVPALPPEMLRLDISEALLTLKACGFGGFGGLRWLDPPSPEAAERAEKLLRDLGAADEKGALTAEGRAMSAYPLHPRYSRMVVEAKKLGCARECAIIAAAAQGRGIRAGRRGGGGTGTPCRMVSPADAPCRNRAALTAVGAGSSATGRMVSPADAGSDLAAAVKELSACAAAGFDYSACEKAGLRQAPARDAWRMAERLAGGAAPGGTRAMENAARCFLLAFPDRVAALFSKEQGRYRLPGGRNARLDPASAAAGAPLICAGSVVESAGRGGADITLSFAAPVKEEWLRAAFPGDIREEDRPALDKDMLTPVTERLTFYRDVEIRKEITSARGGKASADLIADEFVSGRQKLKRWDEEAEDWLARADFLHRSCPDLGIDPLSEEDKALIIADICHGARSVADAREREVLPALKDWYGREKCRLIDRHAPQRLDTPSGRKARIRYPAGGEPLMEARIQDLFGLNETPRIAAGRVPLVVHILAPSMRPVQVTKDLKSFWAESYPKLKPALARRYPKHKWP